MDRLFKLSFNKGENKKHYFKIGLFYLMTIQLNYSRHNNEIASQRAVSSRKPQCHTIVSQ